MNIKAYMDEFSQSSFHNILIIITMFFLTQYKFLPKIFIEYRNNCLVEKVNTLYAIQLVNQLSSNPVKILQ